MVLHHSQCRRCLVPSRPVILQGMYSPGLVATMPWLQRAISADLQSAYRRRIRSRSCSLCRAERLLRPLRRPTPPPQQIHSASLSSVTARRHQELQHHRCAWLSIAWHLATTTTTPCQAHGRSRGLERTLHLGPASEKFIQISHLAGRHCASAERSIKRGMC